MPISPTPLKTDMNENKQSIDKDADFRKLLAEFSGAPDMEKWHSARAALIAHIDAQLARERQGQSEGAK